MQEKVIIIGGVGGSGTRVVAHLLKENGIFIGDNLNNSLDNLDWPGIPSIVKNLELTQTQKTDALRPVFNDFIKNQRISRDSLTGFNKYTVAVKVPGSFHYLPFLSNIFDNMVYIHVIRHGLDMVFSNNKNQLKNWGDRFDLMPEEGEEECYQLKYWIAANTLANKDGAKFLGNRFYQIKYEDLCLNPKMKSQEILDFLKINQSSNSSSYDNISLPLSFQRYKERSLSSLDPDDIQKLASFGYTV